MSCAYQAHAQSTRVQLSSQRAYQAIALQQTGLTRGLNVLASRCLVPKARRDTVAGRFRWQALRRATGALT